MKHTPLPWHLAEKWLSRKTEIPTVYAADECLRYIALCNDGLNPIEDQEGNPIPQTDNLANANFIVRACNNHYKLLDALKDVKKRVDDSDEWWMDSPDRGGIDMEVVEKAIAEAEAQ